MKKVVGILIAIGLLVVILAACGSGSSSAPDTFDELCALIGEDCKSAPFYNTSDKNIEVEKDEDDGEIWCELTFNSDESKYYIAGINAVPESLEWEAEDGVITCFDIFYTEEAFDYVEEWADENEDSFGESKYNNGCDYFFYTVNGKEVEVAIDYRSCCLSISESNGIL